MENSIENVFNKVFTEIDENINIEANQLNINCLNSRGNKFHLDSDGNLSVNSITTVLKDTSSSDIYDLIYPIGSIYLSVNSINPSTLFNGTWVSFGNGQTIVGVDENQEEFNNVEKTGGEKKHKLLQSEMPEHNHEYSVPMYTGQNLWGLPSYQYQWDTYTNKTTYTNNKGKSEPHNNLQPYITVYMWKRIA